MWKEYNESYCYKHFAATRRILGVESLSGAGIFRNSRFSRLGFLLVVINLTTALASGNGAPISARVKYNFNSGWKVLVGDPLNAEAVGFDDSRWKTVTTPHAWNEDDAFKKDIKDLSTGIAWYRKHFNLPADSAGQQNLSRI